MKEKLSLDELLQNAENGRQFFQSLQKEMDSQGKTLFFLMDTEDEHLISSFFQYLPELMEQKSGSCAVLLTEQVQVVEEFFAPVRFSLEMREISEGESASLLSFYEMYQFSEDFYIISLEKPYGSKLQNLLGKGIKKEEIIKHCILKVK